MHWTVAFVLLIDICFNLPSPGSCFRYRHSCPSLCKKRWRISDGSLKCSSSSSSSSLVVEEQEKLKNVSTKEIKKELNDLGVSTLSYYERFELVKLLAETRARKWSMSSKEKEMIDDSSQRHEQQQRYKVHDDDQIGGEPSYKSNDNSSSSRIMNMDKEMDYIRRVMNFEDIKFELSAFDLSSDGLTYDEAVRTLALSRLRIEPVGDEIENETGLLDGFLHGIRDVVSGGKDSAKSIMNDGIKSVKNVAKTYESGGYTSAEKDAMDVLNGKIPKEEFASTFHSRSSWSIPTDDYDIAKPVNADKVQVSTDKLQESVGRVVHTNNNVASNTFNNNVIGGRKRKKTKVKYVTDNINRDIWTAYFQKFQNFIRPIVNIHLGMDAIRVFLSTGIEVAIRMGIWSGGSDLTPAQSLFVACSICIVFRRGILTFVGTMVSIRLLRIAFLGIDNARETLDDKIDNRGDKTDDANIAY